MNGENNPKIAGTLDIQEALNEIASTIENKMIKIDELQVKDRVIAIRLPNRREYLVLNSLLEFVLNIYTPPAEQE
ncbi:MAG: hypothetical protein EOP45_13880 [Sphingobacteriaceae bacterium]|nr:MAG: hypothetical protein EOP45_13880 [Sphingobacteriaceae bacterium]